MNAEECLGTTQHRASRATPDKRRTRVLRFNYATVPLTNAHRGEKRANR